MLKYLQDGGRKSARVLKLAEKLKTWLEHSDTVLSTAIDEEESEFLLLDLEDEIRTGLYSDATSRDEFTALLNGVHKGDVQSLLSSMKSKLNAWKFNQALIVLRKALVSIATTKGIKDIFSQEVVSKIDDVDMKKLFESTAATILVNTNNEAIGPKGLLLKLASQHNGWTFSQALYPLRKALVSIATTKGIKDIFSQEVVSKIDDVDMKKLFESTAATALVSTNGEAVGPDRLLLKLAAQHTGWSFIQLMNVLTGPFVAAAKAIERETSKDNVNCNTVFNKLDKEAQDLFDKAANMILKSTNDQVVGREGVFMKMVSTHFSRIDETFTKHLNEIVQMKENGSEYIKKVGDDEYVPIIDMNESKEMNTLYRYLLDIRHLKEGDTNYWKKQMFLDKGINISKMGEVHEARIKSIVANRMSGQTAKHKVGVSVRMGKKPKLYR